MAVYIKLAGAGGFVKTSLRDGDVVSDVAKRACAENRCWGVGASQVELVLVAEGGGPPAEATVARALADAGAVQPVNAPAGGLAGAWLVARVIKRATPRAPLRGAVRLCARAARPSRPPPPPPPAAPASPRGRFAEPCSVAVAAPRRRLEPSRKVNGGAGI
jgi:hypothetical protein